MVKLTSELTRRQLLSMSLAAGTTVLLAACGGNDDEGDSSTPPATELATEPALTEPESTTVEQAAGGEIQVLVNVPHATGAFRG
jgi:hypothetical protein